MYHEQAKCISPQLGRISSDRHGSKRDVVSLDSVSLNCLGGFYIRVTLMWENLMKLCSVSELDSQITEHLCKPTHTRTCTNTHASTRDRSITHADARSLAHWTVQLQGGFAKSLPANDAAIYFSGWCTPTQCRWPHRCKEV